MSTMPWCVERFNASFASVEYWGSFIPNSVATFYVVRSFALLRNGGLCILCWLMLVRLEASLGVLCIFEEHMTKRTNITCKL